MMQRHEAGLTAGRQRIVAAARGWIGTPYHHQASMRGVGSDCLGLVTGVWREVYGSEPERPPPYTRDWAERDAQETLLMAARRHLVERDLKRIEAGSVLVFRYRQGSAAKHVGITTGNDCMVHALEGHAVAEVSLTPWWRRRIAAVFAFPGLDD